jgi:hypothetical protein
MQEVIQNIGWKWKCKREDIRNIKCFLRDAAFGDFKCNSTCSLLILVNADGADNDSCILNRAYNCEGNGLPRHEAK